MVKAGEGARPLDRFIPLRSLVDFDSAYEKLNEENPEKNPPWELNPSALCKSQRRLELLRQLERFVGINDRIFRTSAAAGASRPSSAPAQRWPCQPRKPVIHDEKMLDMPEFNCGFHLSPIDWGSNDLLVTSVANKVLIGSNLNHVKVTKETAMEYVQDRCTAASWSPDGRKLAFGSETGFLSIWDICKKKSEVFYCSLWDCTVTVIQWHPDSSVFAWGCTQGKLTVRSVGQKPIAKIKKAHRGCIYAMEYSPQGNYLCSSGEDCCLRIWKGDDYHPYMEIEMSNPSRAIAWHPWRSGLLAVGEGPPVCGSLSLWNVNTAKMLFLKKLPESTYITAITFNKITGELVFSQSVDDASGAVRSEIFVLGGSEYVIDSIATISGTVFSLLWNSDNTKLGAASSDETFRIWNFMKPRRSKRSFSEIQTDLSSLAQTKFKCHIR